MKKTIIFVLGLVVGLLAGIWIPERSAKPEKYESKLVETAQKSVETDKTKDDGTYFGYVKSAEKRSDGAYISVDYATYGSCDEAMIEANNCPNGYFISNVNPKLRTFKFSETGGIVMQTFSHDQTGNFRSNQIIPLGEFLHPQNENLKGRPYWFTVVDGEIIEIREQFLP